MHCFALLVRSNIQYRYLGLSGVTSQDVYLCLPGLPALKQNAQCKMLRALRGRVHSKWVSLFIFLSSISVEPQLQAPGQILLCSTFFMLKKMYTTVQYFRLFVFERLLDLFSKDALNLCVKMAVKTFICGKRFQINTVFGTLYSFV